ncbi:MAG: ActS/PrrB/RegB family redox-sensitive histidine kinase [Pseudomonadota bacterium]
MPDTIYSDMLRDEARGRWVRLRTLTLLRWLAIVGQIAAVSAATQFFGLKLPLGLCLSAIAVSILFNVASMQLLPSNAHLSDRAALISMLFDLAQVSALLFLTGGLTNPFAALLLAPVTMSASVLSIRSALAVALTALAMITAMAFWRLPLVFDDGEILAPPPIYILGVWAALTIAVIFMAVYARRVTIENYRMTLALNAAQRALASEQRLTAIGGLAAAAAHELGTPLATIKLVSAELADELADSPDLREDAELIRNQADRCRDILADLSQGGRSDEHVKTAPITALVEEAAEPHRDRGKQIVIRSDAAPLAESGASAPIVRRSPEMVHGLRNLIQNAVDFADTTIWVDVNAQEEQIVIIVGDDGPGYPEDLLTRLGDPYITSRNRRARADKPDETYQGMGLGLFIAKTLLERTGAEVAFANADRLVRKANRGQPMEMRRPTGAVAAVSWPRHAIQGAEMADRAALGQNPKFTVENI